MKKDFKRIPHIAETGDIILMFNEKNILSKGIASYGSNKNNEKWSHVALYLGSGEHLIFESAFPRGTRIVKLDKYFDDSYTISVRRFRFMMVDTITKIKDAVYSEISLNEGYDIFAFLGFVLGKIFKWNRKNDNEFGDKHDEFCSSILDDVFRKAGIDLFENLGKKQVTPCDWASLEGFEEKIRV